MATKKITALDRILSVPVFIAYNVLFSVLILLFGLRIAFLVIKYPRGWSTAKPLIADTCKIMWTGYVKINASILIGDFGEAALIIEDVNEELEEMKP